MFKFAVLLLLICIVWRWALGQWPWDALKPPPTRSQAIFKARKVLQVEADASREDIMAAHKKLVSKVHPDRGGNSAAVHEANDARDLLLDQLPGKGSQGGSVHDEDAGETP
ncbi:MAG: J domain-containing protein [Pseudomonadota bacterium]